MGITFYPSKHWALAFPCLFCVTLIFFQFVVQGLHMSSCKPLTSIHLMQDEHSKFCSPHDERAEGLPDIYDIPVNVVNTALYYDRYNNPKFYNKNKQVDTQAKKEMKPLIVLFVE
eukprot:TRINITY_DN5161_c0_g1_i3.p2 TRINITY_DN5161_c0_g1~~TRINITY_DN5161_c0_g1_i3.p2  ORF type:complete len:115 (-),score=12.99 TRINITY_DN5161_c0_g1_i3:196-540(-)